MLHVVANVYSQIDTNLQRQNVHQSPSCRVRANRQRPPPAHHLLSGKSGTRSGRRLAGTGAQAPIGVADRKSTRLNSSHLVISYAVFCLKKKKKKKHLVAFVEPHLLNHLPLLSSSIHY